MEKNIIGKVIKGEGLGSLLDFPTVNFINDCNIEPGIYTVKEQKYGDGVVFISRQVCEMHFFKKIYCNTPTIRFSLIKKIECPENLLGSSICYIYYMGLQKYDELCKK